MKVGLIGFGQIGRTVAERIQNGEAGDSKLVAILLRDRSKVADADPLMGITDNAEAFLESEVELVVEVAGHAALRQYAERVLSAGKDLVAISVGAFADGAFLDRVAETARTHGRRVLVPSGAIAGLDMIAAAALAPIESVTHTTRKHPRAFTAKQLGGRPPETEPLLLFDGPARVGVARFPENLNVAAAVSLAGVGLDKTRLVVYADPSVERNQHEVDVIGYFGRMHVEVENIPSENPKTGRIVSLSIAKVLCNLTAPVVIGS